MKIRKLTVPYHTKTVALLRQSFANSDYEVRLFDALHTKGKDLHEWICIHKDGVIAYIAFSHAFAGNEVCGLHLAPLAVKPQFQNQGIGSELLRFALRQDIILENTVFVLGAPTFYERFGFEPCAMPVCPFDKGNKHFLSIRNTTSRQFTVGYEPEFTPQGHKFRLSR